MVDVSRLELSLKPIVEYVVHSSESDEIELTAILYYMQWLNIMVIEWKELREQNAVLEKVDYDLFSLPNDLTDNYVAHLLHLTAIQFFVYRHDSELRLVELSKQIVVVAKLCLLALHRPFIEVAQSPVATLN
jgi:hypothetical protein